MLKLATACINGKGRLVVLLDDGRAIDLSLALEKQPFEGLCPNCCMEMQTFIEAGDDAVSALRAYVKVVDVPEATMDPETLELLAPIPHPKENVISVGRNYATHMKEIMSGNSPSRLKVQPQRPAFLTQQWTAVTGPGSNIEYDPKITQQVDYEGELAVIIGKEGKNIPLDKAMDYVFGYSIMNDASARDIQFAHDLPFKGKSLDTFQPFGPWIVLRDDLLNAQALNIKTWVNEELRQDGNTADMIFKIPELVYYLSMGMTIHPGQCISSGTPSGVGLSFDPPKYLHDGDVVTITIEPIGTLQNTVREVNN